jgi:hypothetical protein
MHLGIFERREAGHDWFSYKFLKYPEAAHAHCLVPFFESSPEEMKMMIEELGESRIHTQEAGRDT